MKNEIDFSVKPAKVEKVFTFPRIYFPGLTKCILETTPYTPENIADIENRKSSNPTLSRLKDKVAKESVFLFAEGFNSYGYAVNYEDDKKDEKTMSEDEIEHFKALSTETLFNEHLSTFSTVFSFFPQKTLSSAGVLLARKSDNYKEKKSPITSVEDYALTSVVRKRSSVNYQDDSLPSLPFSSISYTPSFINTEVNLEKTAPRIFSFSRDDILALFRDNMKEDDYIKALPLFELIASGIENSGIMEHVLPFFVSLNEFIEHGDDEQYFLDYFLAENNAHMVGTYVNNLIFNQYKYTDKIITAMTAPMRIFNYGVIDSSAIRRLVSESKKKTLLAALELNLPISDKAILPKDSSVTSRVKEIFETLEFFDRLAVPNNELRQKVLVSDMAKPGLLPARTSKDIEEIFEIYFNTHSSTVSPQLNKLTKELYGLTGNTFKRYLATEVLDSYAVKPYNLAVILYALTFPGTVNVATPSKVLSIIDYTLKTHSGNVDVLSDMLISFMINFDNFKVAAGNWKEIIDTYNVNLRPQHSIQISLATLEGEPFDMFYSKKLLEVLEKEYKEIRPVL